MSGKQYRVISEVSRSDRDDPADLKKLFVRNNMGSMVSLDNLVSFSEAQLLPPFIILTVINQQLFLQDSLPEKLLVMV